MAANALDALGLDYEDDSDDSEEAEVAAEGSKAPAPVSSLPAVSLPPLAAAAALPDAGDLLSDLRDDVDWDARPSYDDEPTYDPKGTRYNAVALPSSMAQHAEQHNNMTGRKRGPPVSAGSTSALVTSVLNDVGAVATHGARGSSTETLKDGHHATGTVSQSKAQRQPARSGGMLLPPQLRRPNVTTEELSTMRSAKRSKPTPVQK